MVFLQAALSLGQVLIAKKALIVQLSQSATSTPRACLTLIALVIRAEDPHDAQLDTRTTVLVHSCDQFMLQAQI